MMFPSRKGAGRTSPRELRSFTCVNSRDREVPRTGGTALLFEGDGSGLVLAGQADVSSGGQPDGTAPTGNAPFSDIFDADMGHSLLLCFSL